MYENWHDYVFFQFDPAKLRKLRPSFKESGGSVTAGNASSIRSGTWQYDISVQKLLSIHLGRSVLSILAGLIT